MTTLQIQSLLTQAALLDAVSAGRFRAEDAPTPDDATVTFWDHIRYWTREDGEVFDGEMIAPSKPWLDLDDAQREYERELINQLSAENETLIEDMAQMIEEVYQSDMEMMEL